jgi:arylsulfatase A-like enzyme
MANLLKRFVYDQPSIFRFPFLIIIGIGMLLFAGCVNASGDKKEPQKKLNVLLICIDDMQATLGCLGDSFVHSPNIDQLAKEGRLFTRHYVQAAICGPSRCTMLTGIMQEKWDIWKDLRNGKEKPSGPVSLPGLFHQNGYRTICIGKVSHMPGDVSDFSGNPLYSQQKKYFLPYSWDSAFAPVGKWGTPWHAFFSYSDGIYFNKAMKIGDEQRLPYEFGEVADTGYADGLNALAAVDQLQDLKIRDVPFFLAVGFYKPHAPYNSPVQYANFYPAGKIPPVTNFYPPKDLNNNYSLTQSQEPTTHYYWPKGKGIISKSDADTLRRHYFSSVSYVDQQIGKVLNELKKLGLDKTTIVVLWGDNGYHLGEDGIFGKFTNFEVATRTPLIIKTPGIPKAGTQTDAIVETVDLYPTLADLCNLSVTEKLDGKSRKNLLYNPLASGGSFGRSFMYRGDSVLGRRIRNDRYSFVQWVDKKGKALAIELYDCKEDPGENFNIADNEPAIVEKLTAELSKAHFPKASFNCPWFNLN